MSRIALAVAATTGLFLVPARAQDAPAQPAGDVTAYAQTVDRKLTRVAYFGQGSSPGQIALQYGTPAWKDSYASQLEAAKGQRLRLGSDFWTTLDTSMDLTIAGVDVPAGSYYLGAQLDAAGKRWSLVLLDPKVVRSYRADAFLTSRIRGIGIEVPMEFLEHDEVRAKNLEFGLVPDAEDKRELQLSVRFGPYELRADVVANFTSPPIATPAEASTTPARGRGDGKRDGRERRQSER